MNKSFVDKAFKDKEGNIALSQRPNLPIIIWLVFSIIGRFINDGTVSKLIDLIAFGAIFIWAWLELFHGINYFRKLLGFVVLVYILYESMN